MKRFTFFALASIVILGFAVRLPELHESGLSEDEVNKIDAVRSYQNGSFEVNVEHPLLMKTLMLASVSLADAVNRAFAADTAHPVIPEETAVRLPNVLVGAFTAIPIFLIGAALFSAPTGFLASLLWAVGVNAAAINRIAKEDTLLTFFFLWGFFFHLLMKSTPETDARRKRLFYYLSGAMFGLMLSSKYFPHFWGLTLLFFWTLRKVNPEQCPPDSYTWRDQVRYLAIMAAAFLVSNPLVLDPTVISKLVSYAGHNTVTHHGYMMSGLLFPNSVTVTPLGGTPWYFYFLFVLTKMPLPVLLAFLAGLVFGVRSWRTRGPFFVVFWTFFWFFSYSFVGVKFLRYSLTLMPIACLAAAFGAMAAAEALAAWLSRLRFPVRAGRLRMAVAAVVFVGAVVPLLTCFPFYSLYVNPLGGGMEQSGTRFPHDEYYDIRLREAIDAIAREAPVGSVMAGETPAVFRYYLQKVGRPDIQVVNLSDHHFRFDPAHPVFVVLQPGRIYFENLEFFHDLWGKRRPLEDLGLWGRSAVRIYRLDGQEFVRKAEERTHLVPATFRKMSLNFL